MNQLVPGDLQAMLSDLFLQQPLPQPFFTVQDMQLQVLILPKDGMLQPSQQAKDSQERIRPKTPKTF